MIEVDSVFIRNDVLASAKQLALGTFKDIYIRPDRTAAEQSEFIKLNSERKAANSDLDKLGKLDKPFRFVIRSDKLRCIDVSQEVEINGRKKHPFIRWKDAQAARSAKTQ
jgi:hypothetical protein